MTRTEINSRQIADQEVKRSDLNTQESGQAVITKVIAGKNIELSSTGVDEGTGDVTINVKIWRDNTNDIEDNVLIQSGKASLSGLTIDITFDIAFTSVPQIVATASGLKKVAVKNITTTGFRIKSYASTVYWIAIGEKNDS